MKRFLPILALAMALWGASTPALAADGAIEATIDATKMQWETDSGHMMLPSDFRQMGTITDVNIFGVVPGKRTSKGSLSIGFSAVKQGDGFQVMSPEVRYSPEGMMKNFYVSAGDAEPEITITSFDAGADSLKIVGTFKAIMYKAESPMKSGSPDMNDSVAVEGSFESVLANVK
ncbi:MAG: hypothetical protein ACPGO3_13080 [Magnetospiraceae bacterium]